MGRPELPLPRISQGLTTRTPSRSASVMAADPAATSFVSAESAAPLVELGQQFRGQGRNARPLEQLDHRHIDVERARASSCAVCVSISESNPRLSMDATRRADLHRRPESGANAAASSCCSSSLPLCRFQSEKDSAQIAIRSCGCRGPKRRRSSNRRTSRHEPDADRRRGTDPSRSAPPSFALVAERWPPRLSPACRSAA